MLSEKTIQQVRDASVTQVLSHFLKLDRNGKACCPFHNEKTPSFKVTEAKGIYKCFGCGESGDHISFIMKQEKLGFLEAITRIAELIGLEVEYEEVPDKEKFEARKAKKDTAQEILQFTVSQYRKNLWDLPEDHPVKKYLTDRGFTKEDLATWHLGWGTTDWQHICSSLINKGWYQPASDMGLIKRAKDDRNYDGYRSRIIIPITNRNGQFIGLGGRFFLLDEADAQKNYPKYINPPQSDYYDKSQVLYGLHLASKAIHENSCAYLVEGYFDVISMHKAGHENTVGTCGTALTIQQANLLKRYTSNVIIMRDGDPAGKKAAIRDMEILLKAGFQCQILELPDKEDPDTWVQKDPKLEQLKKQDAIFWHLADLLTEVQDDQFRLGKVKERVIQLLAMIPNDIIRGNYFDSIIRKNKWQKSDLQKQLTTLVESGEDDEDTGETELDKMPKWMDKEEFLANGYCAVNSKNRTGYYSFSSNGQVEITNFLINPIFHVYAGKESRHLIQIDNGRRKAVLDIESKALVSIDLLQQYVVCEGPFIIYGSKPQMLRIATKLLDNFPKCIEVKFLGWQQPGFFAFVDRIYVPGKGLIDLDEWGVYKHQGPESETNYLVPAASAAYKELQKTGDDPYENDRVLTYNKSTANFSTWATMMHRVYREKGPVAVAYAILTMFRDIVFDIDNNCPHLYGFGERSSGKSKWAESINALFFHKRSAFNLNSGTDFAFFAYMQRFINCPSFLNEFDEKIIKPEWFQSIKGAFDGEGRQRGSLGSKNRTEIMKIRSTLILIGQYLCTMDDNSIVSRSIIEGFNERELTAEDKKEFDRLKMMEEGGLSNLLVEVMEYRQQVKEKYRDLFNASLQEWRLNSQLGEQGNIRIISNWCHLFTGWKIISEYIKLPVPNAEFEKYCRERALHWSRFIRSSDTLSEFWNTISFLVDLGSIVEGWDYKIDVVTEIRLRRNRKEEFLHQFAEPTKVIYMRMNNIHKHYQQAFRSRTGKEGMTMENLEHYFSSRKYFIGSSKQSRFRRFVTKTENVTTPGYGGAQSLTRPETTRKEESILTSSYVFLYEDLGLDIEREAIEMTGQTMPVLPGIEPVKSYENSDEDSALPF